MRSRHSGTIMVFWLGAGILLSSAAANAGFTLRLADPQRLYEGLCTGWQKAAESRIYAGLRVVPLRLLQILAVINICRSKVRQAGMRLILLAVGCSLGGALVMMSRVRGIFGILPFLASRLPQGLCYLAAGWLYLFAGLEGLPDHTVRFRVLVFFMILGGICMEICTAPQLIINFL